MRESRIPERGHGSPQEKECKHPRKEVGMLTAYINAALRKAHYEMLPDGEGYFGAIEGLQGVWAQAETLEACREELREVLEEWIVLGLKMGHTLPSIDGMTLTIQEVA
jgi:predicted RNase H-like HicB family nuclease